MPEPRRAILHIGTEKTGTSSLQSFLARNRDRLNARGFHYPVFAGPVSHEGLAAYAMADDRFDDLRLNQTVHDAAELAAFRADFERRAAEELAAHAGRTIIFSGEHCSSRLRSRAEVARLKALLGRFFDRIDVAVYLRRQDEVAVSLYSTALKSGNEWSSIFPALRDVSRHFDYDGMLRRWASEFGPGHVHPRIFAPDEMAGGSVVEDFCEIWKLGGGYQAVARTNESLCPPAQEFLRRLNRAVPPVVSGRTNALRGDLAQPISRAYAGKGRRPARAEAQAFLAQFADTNEAVRARWFPERKQLFPDNFSAYPEHEDPTGLTVDEAVEMAAHLWRHLRGRELSLLTDLAIRDGQIAELLGDTAAACEHYRRAVAVSPDRPLPRERLEALSAAVEGRGAPAPSRRALTAWIRTGGVAGRVTTDQSGTPWREAQLAEERTAAWRKRLSLNGLRRLLRLPPAQPGP